MFEGLRLQMRKISSRLTGLICFGLCCITQGWRKPALAVNTTSTAASKLALNRQGARFSGSFYQRFLSETASQIASA